MFTWDHLSDAELTDLCRVNDTVNTTDPNCLCLLNGGGPQLNTDVSGPGVRISFYLQALFLALLATRSDSLNEISGALYTLVATNVSMATTSLILGFKTVRGMSFHDAIVVFYLLSGSWLAIFFSLPSYNRFVKSEPILQVLTVAHSFVIFAFVLAVLVTAYTFGRTPRCNPHAVGVIFFQFPALHGGRIAALVCVCLIMLIYSLISLSDYYRLTIDWYHYHKNRRKKLQEQGAKDEAGRATSISTGALIILPRHFPDTEHGVVDAGSSRIPSTSSEQQSSTTGVSSNAQAQVPRGSSRKKQRAKERYYRRPKAAGSKPTGHGEPTYVTGILGTLVVEIFVIVLLWSLFVMNTELLISRNRFDGGGDGDSSDLWGFGQILPMFLVLLPFVQLVKAFRRLGLRRRQHRSRKHRRELPAEERATKHAQRRKERYDHGRNHGHTHRYKHASPTFETGWSPPFFPSSADAPVHPFDNQPSARISVTSVHSTKSEPNLEEGNRERDKMAYSCRSSRSMSSISMFPNLYGDFSGTGGTAVRKDDDIGDAGHQ